MLVGWHEGDVNLVFAGSASRVRKGASGGGINNAVVLVSRVVLSRRLFRLSSLFLPPPATSASRRRREVAIVIAKGNNMSKMARVRGSDILKVLIFGSKIPENRFSKMLSASIPRRPRL